MGKSNFRSAIARLLFALTVLSGAAWGQDSASREAGDRPIHITFVIHFDPLLAPGGRVLKRSYEEQRDNLAWLADFLEELEQKKGKDFVPRLTLELAGDHAEYYLEDEKGMQLLRRLYQKGIHSWGTHFHRNQKTGVHVWNGLEPSPRTSRRVTRDHVGEVDKLIGKLMGRDDPHQAIRRVNRTITGHLVDGQLALELGFDTQTGGRNEAMNLFFDHDVYNPWRPSLRWNLGEDPESRWLLVPQAPVLGEIGEHAPIPPGISEEYTRGMKRMIWQDVSVPAMQRKFLHLFLEWRDARAQAPPPRSEKIWVFGWHEHNHDLYPDSNELRYARKFRPAVVEYVEWLNAHFIGRTDAAGQRIAKYSNVDEVRDCFLAWEKAHPRQSSFNYPAQSRNWEEFPYRLKGLSRELMYAHYAEENPAFQSSGVQVHTFLKTGGRNWELRDGKIAASAATTTFYLLWSERGSQSIDLSGLVGEKARRVEGASGNERAVNARALSVGEEPVLVYAAENAARAPDTRRPIQFRMNVNYFPDETAAQENYRMLRRYLSIFKTNGVKASFWFTGLAAEQVQRVDPELIRMICGAGMPVAHHGANRPPRPQPVERVKGENWEEDVQAIMDYESYAIDPRSGTLDKSRAGGLKRMQEMFDHRIAITGRFFEASILCVARQFGCRAMIGLEGNTGGPSNAGWFLGMMGMPDAHTSVSPEMLRAAASGKCDLFRVIEGSGNGSTQEAIAVLIHDYDFLQGSPVLPQAGFLCGSATLQAQLWETYEQLVIWAAKHPRFRVVTFEEILDQIADDRIKTVALAAVLKAADRVTASRSAPPEFVDVDGDYLSLADVFQLFAFSLSGFARDGKLPATATARDILGPTRYRPAERPERGSLDFAQDIAQLKREGRLTTDPAGIPTNPKSQSLDLEVDGGKVIAAARTLNLAKEVPSSVDVNGSEINPAVFLQLMAQTLGNIGRSGQPGAVRVNGSVNVLPLSVRQNPLADALTKLQFWTYKPE